MTFLVFGFSFSIWDSMGRTVGGSSSVMKHGGGASMIGLWSCRSMAPSNGCEGSRMVV